MMILAVLWWPAYLAHLAVLAALSLLLAAQGLRRQR